MNPTGLKRKQIPESCSSYLVPETWVVEPLQELLAHDHGAGEEGPVGQQEVLDVSGVHHRMLLY